MKVETISCLHVRVRSTWLRKLACLLPSYMIYGKLSSLPGVSYGCRSGQIAGLEDRGRMYNGQWLAHTTYQPLPVSKFTHFGNAQCKDMCVTHTCRLCRCPEGDPSSNHGSDNFRHEERHTGSQKTLSGGRAAVTSHSNTWRREREPATAEQRPLGDTVLPSQVCSTAFLVETPRCALT